MLSENELIQFPYDVLLIVRVVIVQVRYQFTFHQALLVQALLVF